MTQKTRLSNFQKSSTDTHAIKNHRHGQFQTPTVYGRPWWTPAEIHRPSTVPALSDYYNSMFFVPVGVVAYQVWKKKQSLNEVDEEDGAERVVEDKVEEDTTENNDTTVLSTTMNQLEREVGERRLLENTEESVSVGAATTSKAQSYQNTQPCQTPTEGTTALTPSITSDTQTIRNASEEPSIIEQNKECSLAVTADQRWNDSNNSTISVTALSTLEDCDESTSPDAVARACEQAKARREGPLIAAAQWWNKLQEARQRNADIANLEYLKSQGVSSSGKAGTVALLTVSC